MVYCGKASQGCQNCRTRRIKCDKVKPECSQCIRVGKKCPGYRDQLSLMFRDESTKVIKKAHAQWGVTDGAENGAERASASTAPSPPASSPSYSRKGSPNSKRSASRSGAANVPSPASSSASFSASPSSTYRSAGSSSPPTLPAVKEEHNRESSPPTLQIGSTLEEQGVQFYVNRYLIGHPDEPKNGQDLNTEGWIWHPAVQDVMCAVGLAGLHNLTGNAKMMSTAREKYGSALRHTGKLIRPPHTPSIDVTMRAVVALAMFEVRPPTLCCNYGYASLTVAVFIPLHVAGMPMPPDFYDWVSYGSQLQLPIDRPSTDLAVLIARFVETSSIIHNHVISDGKPKTASVIQQLLDLDQDLASWENGLEGDWIYRTIHATHLPPKAVFQCEYHKYHDVWTARIWNYYRWCRILVNQNLLDLTNKNPVSSLSLVSAAARDEFLNVIRHLARDILISAPTHWRHPALDGPAQITVESPGGGGAGSAGLPALLFHLKVAGCAPGVPKDYWEWALGIIQTIWGDMGMLHARSMMEAMRAHEDTVLRTGAAGILADDW
ncbi:hypothetical protein CPAR01_15073 [Colletotrichum paranaense]|uniref:Zn(2)-C6 fungal-type domain-containing protein n=1 Tax=Colletotrichum paranaense TaxID=1914294 RepID=A0ABQ9RZW2_9PEZI|nr:uncharacterized protein CPAR01_15073 [Colletotrichum paranaense]KAK1520022.1 hypothetical protein CPAR01_15073 [Colletotrichum paranaense]